MKELDRLNSITEELYEEMLLYCRGRVPPDDAGDVTQDVFSAFAYEWSRKPVEYPRQWLYRVMKNKISDYYREKRRHDKVIAGSLDEEMTADSENSEESEDDICPAFGTEMPIDDDLSGKADPEALAKMIVSSLSDAEKVFYNYRYVDRLTYNEIAEREKLSVSAVRRRLDKINDRLKSMIKKALGG